MSKLVYTDNYYRSPARTLPYLTRVFPSFIFYLRLVSIVFRASRLARKGKYDSPTWAKSSLAVLRGLEDVGVCVDIVGIENIERHNGPVVIIGNHMSMMETMLLPIMIQPIKPITYVVKETLLSYPVFRHVMRSRNPITVTRTDPRHDLKTVLTEGLDRLQWGISIIVFPQTTRSHSFDSGQMSSIGVKLAHKAEVPIVPLALKTDCWQNGRINKNFGKMDIKKTAYFAFGEPIFVKDRGGKDQEVVNRFIARKLEDWSRISDK